MTHLMQLYHGPVCDSCLKYVSPCLLARFLRPNADCALSFSKIAIKDTQTFGAMIEGLEVVTSLLPRYAIFEDLYLRNRSQASECLNNSLTMLYSAILIFLARSIHFFGKSTMRRVVSSVSTLTDSNLDTMMRDIRALQSGVDRDARLVDAERQQTILNGVELLSSSSFSWPSAINASLPSHNGSPQGVAAHEQAEILIQLMEKMNQPLNRLADRLVEVHDSMKEEDRLKIFRWLSTIPFDLHHENMRDDRLDKSGLWLLDHPDFRNWVFASYSSILWVHGSPGTGKSKLM